MYSIRDVMSELVLYHKWREQGHGSEHSGWVH